MFTYRKNLLGDARPVEMDALIKNSAVIEIGDVIRIDNAGLGVLATEGSTLCGVVTGVVSAKGLPVDPDSGSLTVYTMESDNQTDKMLRVKYIPALPNYVFYNDADGSLTIAELMQYVDLLNEHQVKTSTLTDTATAQLQLLEIDPDHDGDASKGLFRFAESQYITNSVAA